MRKTIIVLFLFFLSVSSNFASEIPNLYRANLFTYGGLPVSAENGPKFKILINTGYAVGYSDKLENPVWTAYRLGNLKSNIIECQGKEYEPVVKWERPWKFFVDDRTVAKVTHEDYTGSGYDRGHMVPNAAMLEQYGQMAQLETFLMSNICPQKPELNRKIWANLESKIRDVLSQNDKKNKEVHNLYVIAGPIFKKNPIDKLDSGVAIPDEFFKIIAFRQGYRGTVKAIPFIFPQTPMSDNFMDYSATIDEIESLTGLNFFPELSSGKQHNLESKKLDFNLEELN